MKIVWHKDTFKGLRRLQILTLYGNKPTFLPQNFLKGLISHQYISLNNNSLGNVPNDIFKSLNLLDIRLDHNLISLDENLFQSLSSPVQITLDNNVLTFLTGKIFKGMMYLRVLTLHSNNLTSLDSNVIFQGLESLTTLTLANNALSFFDRWSIQRFTFTKEAFSWS